MEIKEWLEHDVTRYLTKKIESEKLYALEFIVTSVNKEESCGIYKGINRVLNLIYNLEEEV